MRKSLPHSRNHIRYFKMFFVLFLYELLVWKGLSKMHYFRHYLLGKHSKKATYCWKLSFTSHRSQAIISNPFKNPSSYINIVKLCTEVLVVNLSKQILLLNLWTRKSCDNKNYLIHCNIFNHMATVCLGSDYCIYSVYRWGRYWKCENFTTRD